MITTSWVSYVSFAASTLLTNHGTQAANFTYDPDFGGFGDDNAMSIDPRGFKSIIQAEAATFLKPSQLMLNATVKNITYSGSGVEVALATGEKMLADYVLSTFSLGVLQNDDVQFHPSLPDWKLEAIHGMTLVNILYPHALLLNWLKPAGRKHIRRFSCSFLGSSGLIQK